MSKYELVSGIIFPDGTLIPAGKVVELDDDSETTKGYLERGSVKPFVEGEEETPSNEPTQIEGEVSKEFELEGYTYKQLQTAEGVRYTQNDVEISEDEFVRVLQITIAQGQDSTPALAPVPPVVGGEAPTQEQIDADLKAAGV